MEKCVALIAGVSGIVGRAMLQHLEGLPDWRAIGLSRRPPDLRTRARLVSLDLLDSAECERVLSGLSDVTHVFYTAFNQLENLSGEVAANVNMLRNVVEVLERCAPGLEHVQLMQGSKWYGSHLGPYPTPAREDQPRHPMPHFYFAQQDWLSARQAGRPWTWSAIATNMFNAEWDQMSSMTKARNAGWAGVNETREMIRRQFDRLARDGVIQNPGGTSR